MMMVTIPPRRCSSSRLTVSIPITPKTETVVATNTAVNPATNSAAAPVTRHRPDCSTTGVPLPAVGTWMPDTPARYDKYPGTSGRQHGDANDTTPASAAAPKPNNSGPDAAAV